MTTKERLENVFRDVFEDDEIVITDETTAEDIEEWDSLTHIQLVVETEKEFGIKFTTVETMKLKNVGEFIALIEKKINA